MANFASSATTCGARKHAWTNNFRILLPGGGTGNTVVGLGEQLNHTNAEV